MYASGLIRTRYRVSARPEDASEVGIGYRVDDSADRHLFRRDGRWSCHPADHIGRDEGTAARHPPDRRVYGQRPEWPWASDEIDFHLYGRMDAGGREPMTSVAANTTSCIRSCSSRGEGGRSVAWDGAPRACGSVRFPVDRAFITASTTIGRFRSPPRGTRSGATTYTGPCGRRQGSGRDRHLFIGDRQDIVMDYLEV